MLSMELAALAMKMVHRNQKKPTFFSIILKFVFVKFLYQILLDLQFLQNWSKSVVIVLIHQPIFVMSKAIYSTDGRLNYCVIFFNIALMSCLNNRTKIKMWHIPLNSKIYMVQFQERKSGHTAFGLRPRGSYLFHLSLNLPFTDWFFFNILRYRVVSPLRTLLCFCGRWRDPVHRRGRVWGQEIVFLWINIQNN